jgi:hypothetical protein
MFKKHVLELELLVPLMFSKTQTLFVELPMEFVTLLKDVLDL